MTKYAAATKLLIVLRPWPPPDKTQHKRFKSHIKDEHSGTADLHKVDTIQIRNSKI